MADVSLTPTLVRQFDRLQEVREEWCNSHSDRANADRINETIILDGSKIDSVPSFFLELGQAVNGPNGYFGACLDSLSDCLCGGFGLAMPITIEIRDSRVARERLGPAAAAAWTLVRQSRTTASPDDDAPQVPASPPPSPLSYFDLVLKVFQDAGVTVRLRGEGKKR